MDRAGRELGVQGGARRLVDRHVNYGANATPGGPNIPLALGASQAVKFYYSNATHWVADNVGKIIASVPGSFQSELGCPGDWQPECLRSWLQDPEGDGVYGFSTTSIPSGSYECKVAHDESWTVNYGAGGVQNGANIPFTVPGDGAPRPRSPTTRPLTS